MVVRARSIWVWLLVVVVAIGTSYTMFSILKALRGRPTSAAGIGPTMSTRHAQPHATPSLQDRVGPGLGPQVRTVSGNTDDPQSSDVENAAEQLSTGEEGTPPPADAVPAAPLPPRSSLPPLPPQSTNRLRGRAEVFDEPLTGKPQRANGLATVDTTFDIVYTWVNGSDPTRLAQRTAINKKVAQPTNRDRDNGEFRYSLRSIQKYMPWWNGTLYVVAVQTPNWLRVDHPRLRLIRHEDLFTNAELPTFNSLAIESRIHRIPTLSRRFVLMNDDFIIGAPLLPTDFFVGNHPVLHVLGRSIEGSPRAISNMQTNGDMFLVTLARARAMLEKSEALKQEPRYRHAHLYKQPIHAPYSLDRQRLERLEGVFAAEFADLAMQRARTYDAFYVVFLHHHDCLLHSAPADDNSCISADKQSAVEDFVAVGGKDFNWKEVRGLDGRLRRQFSKFICLNDEQKTPGSPLVQVLFQYVLPAAFPSPSQWELRHMPPPVLSRQVISGYMNQGLLEDPDAVPDFEEPV